ncbi:MAG: MATE family efflux transporter [Planctomycetales bacterium]
MAASEPHHVGGDHPPGSLRELLAIAIPMIISTGSLTLMQVVDRIFLTWDSPDCVAACLPAGMMHWLLMSPAFGTAMYVTTFVAQYMGAGEKSRVGSAVWQGTIFSFVSGIVLVAGAQFARQIFAVVGHDPHIATLEAQFFSIMCFGSIPTLLSCALSGYFAGQGRTRVVMFVNICGAVVNLVLDPVLIFGFAGIPALSIRGAAIATVMGEVAMTVLYIVLILRDPSAREFGIWPERLFQPDLFLRLLRFGIPNGFHFLSDVCAFSVFIFLIGTMGKHALTATNLAFNLNMLTFMPVLGMGMAVMTLVGNRIGEGRPDLATKTTYLAFCVSAGWMLTFGIMYFTIPNLFLGIYQSEKSAVEFEEIRQLAMMLLKFIAVYGVFDAMAIIFSFAIRGAGDTRFALCFSLVCGWTIMVLPTWLSLRSGSTSLVIPWLSCTGFIMVVGIGFFLRFLQGKWKRMRVIEVPAADGENLSNAEEEPAVKLPV